MPAKRSRKLASSRVRAQQPRSRRSATVRMDEFSRLLLGERKRLREELTEMEEHQLKTEEKPVADVSGYDDDLVDVATETFEREKELALESSVQGILEMVEQALQKIHDGTYGVCEGCAKPIDGRRLRAIPYARLCIKCKEREERHRAVAR
jgi:DnaK suppressor protein